MNRWFRFYEEAAQDSKVLLLPTDTLRWQWVVLLTVASQHDGIIPSAAIAACALRVKPSKATAIIIELAGAGLLDKVEGGYFAPHNWIGRQFKSDKDLTAAERQARYRERHPPVTKRKSNALHNADETREVTRTETEAETEKIEGDARASPSLISQGAIELSNSILRALDEDREAPDWHGFPYIVQMWLTEKIPQDFIMSACSSCRVRHQKYLDKAVRNGWRDRVTDQQSPRKSNGPNTGNAFSVVQAARNLATNLAAFDEPAPSDDLEIPAILDRRGEICGGTSGAHVRLLSKG